MGSYIRTAVVAMSICCSLPIFAVAESGANPTPSVPSCTLADVTAAMASDPNCSLQNAVVFGPNVVDFVTTQCAPFAAAAGSSDKKPRSACMHCAKDAWSAFRMAAEAKLISAKPRKENLGQIKKLCGYNGGDKDNGEEDSNSAALKNLYGQLKLCLPDDGQQANPETCKACSLSALNAALSSGAINQNKFNVMKTSIEGACLKAPRATPAPTPASEENSFKKYGQALKACFDRYITEKGRDAAGCVSCIESADAAGLDPLQVRQYVEYAVANCNGGNIQPSPTATPNPTPNSSGNSLSKYGQGLNMCFQQFITDNRDSAGCSACVNAVDAAGLDSTVVASYLSYATARCNGTNI